MSLLSLNSLFLSLSFLQVESVKTFNLEIQFRAHGLTFLKHLERKHDNQHLFPARIKAITQVFPTSAGPFPDGPLLSVSSPTDYFCACDFFFLNGKLWSCTLVQIKGYVPFPNPPSLKI